jgi:tryptophan-rich sensory protein
VKQNNSTSWLRHMDFSVVAVLPVLVASILGQIATTPNLVPWYAELVKLDFTPPSGIFPLVWAVLYLLMAFAAWRIAVWIGFTSVLNYSIWTLNG